MLRAALIVEPQIHDCDVLEKLRANRYCARCPVHDRPMEAHERAILFPIVRDSERRSASEAGRVRPSAATDLQPERRAGICEYARLPGLAELVPRRSWMNLCEVLRDDAHRKLNLAPAIGAFLRDRLLDNDLAQAAQRHDADDCNDCHRDEQFDEREATRGPHPPAPISAENHRTGRKPAGGGGSIKAESV